MAIEEINQRRGLRGWRVEAAVVDGRSSGPEFARKAEWLLTREAGQHDLRMLDVGASQVGGAASRKPGRHTDLSLYSMRVWSARRACFTRALPPTSR